MIDSLCVCFLVRFKLRKVRNDAQDVWEEAMDHFTPIDLDVLSRHGAVDLALYEHTIAKLGVWGYLENEGVALKGHFGYSGGGHGDAYINIRDLKTMAQLCVVAMQMAWECRDKKVDAFVGTPHGADTLATLVALYYTKFTGGRAVEVLKPLKNQNGLVWYKDHGEHVRGKRIIQVEDVINSAKSLRETADFIISSSGNFGGFIAVCNRISEKNPGLRALSNCPNSFS